MSKFLFRYKNKHLFNPTNFALATGLLLSHQVWIDPTQWHNGAFLAFFTLCMGTFVTNKACRYDVSFAFIITYAVLLFSYHAWAGHPLAVPLAKIQMASLLIFTFFMISDPKTTPNSHLGRIIFGSFVALLGIYLQIAEALPGGLILALIFSSVLVPFLDHIFQGEVYTWKVHSAEAPDQLAFGE